ncbi:MAG: ATP-dependent DNA helicase [Acidobacteriota bacterium]|nr:MAG: ATP-dependent DNA helicase [Acidobacteriota bacterium]
MRIEGFSLEEVFRPGGILDQSLPDYEFRPSQLEMAGAVLDALENSGHLCVEAGTGTGKTLAYLLPALLSEKRVIISTATKNLQEQLVTRDIPFLQSHVIPNIRVTCMKGRQNYLCLRRFAERRRQGVLDVGRHDFDRKVGEWLRETETGDRADLTWLKDDDPLWFTVDARSDTCIGQKCSDFSDCFVTRMRQQAFESDLVIVNHALFFANLSLETDEIGSALPDFSVLVLDEAHEVEDVAADHLGRSLSNFVLEDLCRSIGKAFGSQQSVLRKVDRLQRSADRFFGAFPPDEGRHSLNLFRRSGAETVDLRLELGAVLEKLMDRLQEMYHAMEAVSERPDEFDALLRRMDRVLADLDEIFNLDNPDNVYWYQRSGRGLFIHLTPISVAGVLREKLFKRADTVVLTSATLTAQDSFTYLRKRLGVPECEELIVPGEFDYEAQSAIYIPSSMPEPRTPGYPERLRGEFEQLLEVTDGYAFLLFTTYQQMRWVHESLRAQDRFPLLLQGDMPKTLLLEEFRSTPRAVLCATASFWQGVDVRGDALRSVIIDKLPFKVPSEPIVAARLQRLEQQGVNPFMEYSVPDAVITLRQGLGRLIRSKKDTGILAILDSRIRRRKYGKLFLNSLPKCLVTDNIGNLENFFRGSVSR